jgi:hypothetical protein
MSLPSTRAGYRTLVESQDLTTATGAADYTELMLLAKTADQYYQYIEAVTSAIKPENYSTNIAYQRALAGLPSYADGGMAIGPDSGYQATLHGTELVVSPKKSYPATITGASYAELVAEVKALRKEIAQSNASSKVNSDKVTRIINQWEGVGLPETRTVS